MNKALNREITRLALPSILANMTIPVVGLVDTAIAGHIHAPGAESSSVIAAVSVASLIFMIIYWGAGFLRTGTGGLTAQAFGEKDAEKAVTILARGLLLALVGAAAFIILQWPVGKLGVLLTGASREAKDLAETYFFVRIWAAPATLSLMVFSGWFIGMQDSRTSMWKDLIVNGVNIVASFFLALGAGTWEGMGIAGVALGTVIAQYTGLAYCIFVCFTRYRKVIDQFTVIELKVSLAKERLSEFMTLNKDLFWRSVYMIGVYVGYIIISSLYGDKMMACGAILNQMLMLFSYFADGFAHAGEALTGRFIGEKDRFMLEDVVKHVFAWAMGGAAVFAIVYWMGSLPILKLMSEDVVIVDACKSFLPWLIFMPLVGFAAFTWDGIYLGATSSRLMKKSMKYSFVGFGGVWIVSAFFLLLGKAFIPTESFNTIGIHLLLLAYFVHLAIRTFVLTRDYKTEVLSKANADCTALISEG